VGEPLVLEEHVAVTAWGCWAKAADKPKTVNAVKIAMYFDDIGFLQISGLQR
jgi:hypothetical protein